MATIHDTIQDWLRQQNLEFTVRTETFIIDGDGPKPFRYIPHYVILGKRIKGKTVVVEPVTSFAPQGGLKRVQTFRSQFNDKYHVVLVTKKRMMDKIPPSAYDQLIEFESIAKTRLKIR